MSYFFTAWLGLSQLAHQLQKVPIGLQQLEHSSTSVGHSGAAALIFLVIYCRKNVAVQAFKNLT